MQSLQSLDSLVWQASLEGVTMKAATPLPLPRPSHSHSHSHSHKSKTSTTPSKHTSRAPTSASASTPKSRASFRSPDEHNNAPRSASPNYFGLSIDPAGDPRDSDIGPKENWLPPSSSIRSFNTQSPKHLPLDANPDFEAFRRESENNTRFNFSHGRFSSFGNPVPIQPDRGPRASEMGDIAASIGGERSERTRTPEDFPATVDVRRESGPGSLASFLGLPRHASPSTLNSNPPPEVTERNNLSDLDARHPRLSLPSNKADPPSPRAGQSEALHRAETLPTTLELGPAMISVHELRALLRNLESAQYLLLDLRVAPQYSQARIRDALNLCIPTTLLKRPSFNLEKVTDTFKIKEERARFSAWKDCDYIIVYDAHSSTKKDATSAINTLKKFDHEGWNGHSYILRGGMVDFAQTYPDLIDHRSSRELQAYKRDSLAFTAPDVAPVAGGCEMPTAKSAANPFFGNIRQNIDLVGGVGQMDLQRPNNMDSRAFDTLPAWIRKAASVQDHGKIVSDKFLHIEEDELTRMQRALSPRVSYGSSSEDHAKHVQIAGFEKGGKNRYNNIWPFEHARVRLQRRLEGECDYVNASHIKARWSNKRYIASQGPLPATFEDFWSVVWDQDVRVIVMLTAESEGGQLKCHPYWAAQEYGAFNLKALSEKRVSLDPRRRRRSSTVYQESGGRRRANTTLDSSPSQAGTNDHPHVVVRKFALSHSAEPFKPMREITQLHYSAWPDFGAPAQPSHLLGLVELCSSIQRAVISPTSAHQLADGPEESSNVRPILVHCSAGCGRTGTFCTVDSVIDMLKRQRHERQSGVTPMEVDCIDKNDYMQRWNNSSAEDDDWIFNGEVDLVERTVEDFRSQRISMVQSLRQYVLCYETVLEWLGQQLTDSKERRGSEPRDTDGPRSA